MSKIALIALLGAASISALGCSVGDTGSTSICPEVGGCDYASEEARSSLAHDASPDVADADAKALVAGNTAFGLDLFQRLAAAEPGENLISSPISATAALAMTYAGARGDTATEMATALRFTLPTDKFHPAMNQLSMTLAGRNIAKHTTEQGDKSLRLSLVNSLWAERSYTFVPEFLDGLSVNYDAGVKLLDFANEPDLSRVTINNWVSAKTEDRISDLLGPGSITESTRLVLVNALYFYGSWATAFDTDLTKNETFHALTGEVQAPTMHDGRTIPYAEGEGYQVIDLPYHGDALAMRIVLPAAGQLDAVRAAITPEWMGTVDAALSEQPVALSLPKFTFKWGTTSLKPALVGMGMKKPFEAGADFSGMDAQNDLSIADVVQQAFIGVDEYGTEAAAATAVIMVGTGEPGEPAVFNADRPFVFFIRDASGSILFAGQVTDPTK